MLHAMLKLEGWKLNVKRIRRLCQVHGLTLPRRRRRKRRGLGTGVPCRAEYLNHVWTYDFMHDWCEDGGKRSPKGPATMFQAATRMGAGHTRSQVL